MFKIIILIFASLFLITFTFVNSSSPSENIFNVQQDISFEVEEADGTIHEIEVFKSNLNDDIINKESRKDYQKLKWFSYGVPSLNEKNFLKQSCSTEICC